jgi:hypothetical protein
LLERGRSFIGASRFALDPDATNPSPLPYLTFRPLFLAARFFDADLITFEVRPAHSAFMKRIFRAQVLAGPRQSNETGELLLLALDVKRDLRSVLKRFPVFRSSSAEQERYFSNSDTKRGGPAHPDLLIPGYRPVGLTTAAKDGFTSEKRYE